MKNGGMPPILSVTASAPMSTQTTPGAALAALASMLLITACACGESTARHSIAAGAQVADILAGAGGETLILDAANGLSDAELAQSVALSSSCQAQKAPSTISAVPLV